MNKRRTIAMAFALVVAGTVVWVWEYGKRIAERRTGSFDEDAAPLLTDESLGRPGTWRLFIRGEHVKGPYESVDEEKEWHWKANGKVVFSQTKYSRPPRLTDEENLAEFMKTFDWYRDEQELIRVEIRNGRHDDPDAAGEAARYASTLDPVGYAYAYDDESISVVFANGPHIGFRIHTDDGSMMAIILVGLTALGLLLLIAKESAALQNQASTALSSQQSR